MNQGDLWAALKVERGHYNALRGNFQHLDLLPYRDYYWPLELRLMRRNRLSKERVLIEVPFFLDLVFIRDIDLNCWKAKTVNYTLNYIADHNDVIVAIPDWQMTDFQQEIRNWNERVKTRYESGRAMTRRERKEWRKMTEGLAVLKSLMDEGLETPEEVC